jgi:hypothetical protein
MQLSFDFNPGDCGVDCKCDPVAYIQIVRTVDSETEAFLYPSSEKEDRANENGWYLDRLEGKIWGYYGRNDDGTFASNMAPGTQDDPAILFDSPSRVEGDAWMPISWQAVSVPVCIQDGSGCQNKLLGYRYWDWTVDAGGVVGGPSNSDAGELTGEVDTAVAEWNKQAPDLGKNVFPAFTKLP